MEYELLRLVFSIFSVALRMLRNECGLLFRSFQEAVSEAIEILFPRIRQDFEAVPNGVGPNLIRANCDVCALGIFHILHTAKAFEVAGDGIMGSDSPRLQEMKQIRQDGLPIGTEVEPRPEADREPQLRQ